MEIGLNDRFGTRNSGGEEGGEGSILGLKIPLMVF